MAIRKQTIPAMVTTDETLSEIPALLAAAAATAEIVLTVGWRRHT